VTAAVALALVACGGRHVDKAYVAANTALLERLPVYPDAAGPQTNGGGNSNTEFGSRDWMLPARASADAVLSWYVPHLQATGWRITGKNSAGLHAVHRGASLDVGVRGRTLEVIVDSRGSPE
jgi:hypothetical protein